MEDVLKKVLEDVTPTKAESKAVKEAEEEIVSRLSKECRKLKVSTEVLLGGSASRGTFLRGNHDLDFFIRFKSESDIKKYYKKIAGGCFKNMTLMHGTRDYYKFKHGEYDVEIVPSVKFNSPKDAENSADISYFHIEYLKKKYAKNKKLVKEVLLLKQFLKANEVYGAESARSGFSGYAAELLIIYFKTFKNLLEFFEKNKPKIFIDVEKHYSSEKEAYKAIGEAKTKSPIILVDPLLPKRNAAASLSYEAFSNFLFKARYFLREPMQKMFNKRGLNSNLVTERSERRGTKTVILGIKEDRNEFDITKSKLLRKAKQLKGLLEREGWSVYSYGVTDDKKVFFELETIKVSRAKKHYGPEVWADAEDFDKFFKKWHDNAFGKPYVYDNKLVVDVLRKEDAEHEIREYLKDFLL